MFVRRAAFFAFAFIAGSFGLTAFAPDEASAALSVSMSRVSVGPEGVQASARSVSADGRYVVFGSRAENLVPDDNNGRSDVFRYDTDTGTIIRVSVGAGGAQGGLDSDNPAISADGRYIAFSSAAGLVPGDGNGLNDVYLYDAQDASTVLVSAANNAGHTNNGSGYGGLGVSSDGRYVVYGSYASNLVLGDTNNSPDVFRYDSQTGTTIRVSVATNGTQANGESHSPAVSADGRYISYTSLASNLVTGDSNATTDVFRHDVVTGATTRISRASDGTQGNQFSGSTAPLGPWLSEDGRHIVYQSAASNLVPGDTNGAIDVFHYDAADGSTTRVSTNAYGGQANGPSHEPSISGDGRYITFSSGASNLVAGDSNGSFDVFTHDTHSGAVARVSVSSTGAQGNKGSDGAVMSADGHHVVFTSEATNLVPGDANGQMDLFVGVLEGAIEVPDPVGVEPSPLLVSVSSSSGQLFGNAGQPSVSADGRYVAFATAADLVPGDTNNGSDIFLRDTVAGTTVRISNSTGGNQANQESWWPSISANGRYVAFSSSASNLVAGDTNNLDDVFVRDTVAGTTVRISRSSGGTQANGGSQGASISADGQHVAFASFATNLVAGDTNGERDLFRYNAATGAVTRVNVTGTGTQANASSFDAAVSGNGRYFAYTSLASNLVPGDTNGTADVFRYDSTAGTVTRVGQSANPPTISTDGRYIAFRGYNGGAWRYDAQTGVTLQVAVGNSGNVTMSADGRYIAFTSESGIGSTSDTNQRSDVFRHDAENGTTIRLSDTSSGIQANDHSYSPAISPDGSKVAFATSATNLTRCDTNGSIIDVYIASADMPVTPADHSLCAMAAPTAVAGDGEITARWQRPVADPGYEVTGYTVTAQPGNHTVTADDGSIEATISGLTNGTAYTVTVTATNAVGESPASEPSAPVTPRTTPTPPTSVTATPGNAQLSVDWSAPSSDGGAAITGYAVTAQPGNHTVAVAGGVTHATIPHLTNGTAYTVTVTATNAAGDSPASSPSDSATPRTTPGAPTAVSATPGVAEIDVEWTAPGSDGGAPITGYTVVAQPGGHDVTVDGTTTHATVTGLTNGTTYTVNVTATNAAGNSPAGFASGGVTPHAPGNVVAYDSTRSVPADGSAGVELAGFDSSGGVLSYTVTTQPTHGNLTGTAPHLVYEPDTGYTGPDAIGWSVSSSYGGSASATVSIDVRSDGANVVSQTVEPGQTVATGSTVNSDAPAQAAVTSPTAGEVTITATASDDPGAPAPTGYGLVGSQYVIEAPDATAADPLHFVFLLSASSLPAGVDPDLVTVFRNGTAIEPCANNSGTATPDPCVASRTRDGDTITIEVLSSHASTWATGVKGALTVTTTTPPAGTEGVVATTYAMKATGGTGILRWSVADGVLPTGMKLSTSGSLSGTPQCAVASPGCAVGTSTFMVQVTDSSVPGKWGLATVTMTVKPMTITVPLIKPGRLWVAYPSTTFKAVGGGTPLAWSAVGLPAGMKISASGTVSGTPTVAGTFPVTVKVRNTTATWRVATKNVTFVVGPMVIASNPVVPKVGKVGTYYSLAETVTGGKGTKAWSVASGSLPPGLKLSATSGAVAGTPTVAGTYTFTVSVRDAAVPQNTATATYTIDIVPKS